MLKRLPSVLLAILLTLALLAGCGGGANTAGATTAAATTAATTAAATTEAAATRERVNLIYYTMGDPQPDYKTVEDAINAILLEKFNATLEFRYSTWTDFQQKYSTQLTAGESDMMYTAGWLQYGLMANAGAYLELDSLLDEYAPTLRSIIGEDALNTMRVGGKIYAVPNLWPEYVPNGVAYREDLRAKFDLPIPNSLENMETFLSGIKENMPEQSLLRLTTEESTGMDRAFDASHMLELKYPWVNSTLYGIGSYVNSPTQMIDYWYSQDFIDDMKLLKRWADLGFWSRSALSDTNDPDWYKNGMMVAFVTGQNPNKTIQHIDDFAKMHPDWINGYFSYGEITGAIWPAHQTQNATAFSRGTKHAGVGLQILEYIMTDNEMNKLVQCGIEGTHYKLEDGLYYSLPEGVSPPPFNYEGFNTWNMRVEKYMLVRPGDLYRNEIFERLDKVAAKTKYPRINIGGGFSENYEEYQAERTAVSNILRQYLAPIQAGFVDDVEASIADFLQKAEAAGLQACRDNYLKQWLAYCEEFGYE